MCEGKGAYPLNCDSDRFSKSIDRALDLFAVKYQIAYRKTTQPPVRRNLRCRPEDIRKF